MIKDRPNKLPKPKTIASHYADGKYCDYPADIVLGAVNAFDYNYNSIAIPIQIGFNQMFVANFKAFVYLCEHKNDIDIESFLADPNEFMKRAGIEFRVPFNDIMPRIMVAMLDDDMLSALRSTDLQSVCKMIYSDDKESWTYRHPERYDRTFMKRNLFYNSSVVPCHLETEEVESAGFNDHMSVNLLFIADFFAADI